MIKIQTKANNLFFPKCTYKPNQHDKDKCLKFADDISTPETVAYYKSKSPNPDRVTKQSVMNEQYFAKIAELAGMQCLRDFGFDVNEPDFNIYDVKDKSFSLDLIGNHPKLGDVKVAVKAQLKVDMTGTKNTPSYAFTRKDRLLTSPKEDEYVLMLIANEDESFTVVKMLSAPTVFPDFVDELMSPHSSRVAIYFRDIKNGLNKTGELIVR